MRQIRRGAVGLASLRCRVLIPDQHHIKLCPVRRTVAIKASIRYIDTAQSAREIDHAAITFSTPCHLQKTGFMVLAFHMESHLKEAVYKARHFFWWLEECPESLFLYTALI